MACPGEKNVLEKYKEKRKTYQQLVFEVRERDNQDTELCRLCGEVPEGVMHITSGCKMLASSEYITRHNNLLKILMVAWCKENELMKGDQA